MKLAFLTATIGLLISGGAFAQAQPTLLASPQAPPPPACSSPEHRQFDFWVGYWDVYPTGKDKVVAHSLIEGLYGGCGVRENWMPLRGSPGGSLNSYLPEEKKWRQVWIDSGNSWGMFEGSFQNGAMVLTGDWKNVNGPGTTAFTRTTWSRNSDGSVRQFGEARGSDGQWSPAFDFTYKRSADRPPN